VLLLLAFCSPLFAFRLFAYLTRPDRRHTGILCHPSFLNDRSTANGVEVMFPVGYPLIAYPTSYVCTAVHHALEVATPPSDLFDELGSPLFAILAQHFRTVLWSFGYDSKRLSSETLFEAAGNQLRRDFTPW
jgi:hypothetical protein